MLWLIMPMASCCGQGLSPEESVQRMAVADGFTAQLVAAEPLVRQPVAIEFDDRGRLWVIQYLQYPNPAGLERVQVDRYSRTEYDRMPLPPPHGPRGADRITILEDTNGDGQIDGGKDFVSGLNLATGLAFGHRGVFVLNVPYLLFYPDADRNDVPDSDPEVLLTGFGMQDAHSVANSLTWGPDGWLYGCQGSTVTARIRGIEFQQGVWRYHPITREFELFCEGGGNSWGLDFDATGRLLYSTNYGNYVLLHGVQGAYYVKSFAKHGELHNPFTYGYFDHAPHTNFQGGHVTVGGIVYQGDAFPESYRGQYIAGDLLGHAVYRHNIQPRGSTVATAHGGELLKSADPWFAPTDVTMGPDGAIYVSDWHDKRTAHPDPDADWDRTNGRIVRIAPQNTVSKAAPDFAQLGTQQLLQFLEHRSQWYVRRARQELTWRSGTLAADDPERAAWRNRFLKRATTDQAEIAAVEALWSLEAVCGFDEATATPLLNSPHAAVRQWTVRLLGDAQMVSKEMAHRLDHFAETEPDVSVRQQLACTAKRLPAHQAMPIINANINRDVDRSDPYLPLLWWWAVERHSVSGREEVLRRFQRPTLWKSSLGRDFLLPKLVRRYAAESTLEGLDAVVRLLQAAPDDAARTVLWTSVLQGWKQHSEDSESFVQEVRSHAFAKLVQQAWQKNPHHPELTELAVQLRQQNVIDAARQAAFSDATDASRRADLLNTLAATRDASLVDSALLLIASAQPLNVRRAALQLTARIEQPDVASRLLELLVSKSAVELESDLRRILLARPASARLLLSAVERGDMASDSIPLDEVRQVAALDNADLNQLVVKHWGRLQPQSAGEKLAEVRRLNNDLNAGPGDRTAGRALFTKHCAACHQLFGEGTKLGPDLTTANRQDRQFLLISLVDPNSVIRKEYVSVIVQTTDGRVLSGLPVSRDDAGVTLADGKSKTPITIGLSDIEELHDSTVSLMPADLYRQFSPQQLRDLFAYLQSSSGE